MAKKFDIIVHDNDLDGFSHTAHRENGVMAENAQMLMSLYKMSDQRIEILREYEDEESTNYGKRNMLTNHDVTKKPEDITVVAQSKCDGNEKPSMHTTSTEIEKSTPRYFEIGGIKCKMENGKMYQKQWMRMSDAESSEFRIVSDKNNKICPIIGKHIEVMKWVLIEDESSKSSDKKESLELLNG